MTIPTATKDKARVLKVISAMLHIKIERLAFDFYCLRFLGFLFRMEILKSTHEIKYVQIRLLVLS